MASAGLGLASTGGWPAVAVAGADARSPAYAGMHDGAGWRRDANARIEQDRKGDFSLALRADDGSPIPGAEVELALYRHDFGFGSAVNVRAIFDREVPAERRDQYLHIVASQFHKVVAENALKWKFYAADAPYIDRFHEWAASLELPVRGHALVWGDFDRLPANMAGLERDTDALRDAVRSRVTTIVQRYRGSIAEWDVVNEPFGERRFAELLGESEARHWFALCAEADPVARRYVNDYGVLTRINPRHQQFYFDYIARLLEAGAPLNGIGFQAHTPARFAPTAPEDILETLDRFAVFGVDQQITEFDFETHKRDLQARYTADFMTAVFSHPSTVGLLTWTPFDYVSSGTAKPDAAFYDRRLQARPNAVAWDEYVNGRWTTTLRLHTDATGVVRFRGFKGKYNVNVRTAGNPARYRRAFGDGKAEATITLT